MSTDRLWLQICKLSMFVTGIDEMVQAGRCGAWKLLRTGI